tara:strand:+ start:7874 stop:8197 length:324 start_codon:yes stop_codon:yes gene_type:complete
MKFNLTTAKTVVDLVKQLKLGLGKLSLEDNVEGFTVKDLKLIPFDSVNPEETIVTIQNKLTFVPKQYIITSQVGNGLVTKTGSWTQSQLYLKNNGDEEVIITIFFMR